MLFTVLALLLFLEDRPVAAAVACTVLVLVKETGVIVPAVCGAWLLHERRYREAAYFVAPAVALAGWLVLLDHRTGYLFGSPEFTRYNLFYPLHPVRMAVSLARRLYFLFFENLRWVGTLAIVSAFRKTDVFHDRDWRIAGLVVAAHVILFSALGGAALERYLLPVLPVVYAAMGAGLSVLQPSFQLPAQAVLVAGLVAGNFWNPPYPFPLENNLAFTDFIDLQQRAAHFVSRSYPGEPVTTAWPLSEALRRPELGYVSSRMAVRRMPDFSRSSFHSLDWNRVGVLVVYSRIWNPPWSLIDLGPVRRFWTRYYGYQPEAPSEEMSGRMRLVARWARRGQWADIYVNPRLMPAAPAQR